MKWVRQILLIILITFLGEVIRYAIPLPIPAGIYGLILLFVLLCTKVIKLEEIEGVADFLVEIMPLFFIPAGVGLMTKWIDLKEMLLPFLVAVIVITALVMAVTGCVTQYLLRRGGKNDE